MTYHSVPAEIFGLCATAWRAGLGELIDGEAGSALRLLLNPVGYWRVPVWGRLLAHCAALPPGAAVLDVGSPKIFAFALAATRDLQVEATDLHDASLHDLWEQRWARRFPGRDNFRVRFADARTLPFADASFDVVFSISVIEHIPDEGDALAMKEFHRVLRPGGLAFIEVPFRRSYEELFVEGHQMNETGEAGRRSFYERRYDEAALAQRLLSQSPLTLEHKDYIGERLPGARVYDKVRRPFQVPLLALDVPLALCNLVPCEPAQAQSVMLVLRKSAAGASQA